MGHNIFLLPQTAALTSKANHSAYFTANWTNCDVFFTANYANRTVFFTTNYANCTNYSYRRLNSKCGLLYLELREFHELFLQRITQQMRISLTRITRIARIIPTQIECTIVSVRHFTKLMPYFGKPITKGLVTGLPHYGNNAGNCQPPCFTNAPQRCYTALFAK